MPSRTGRAGTLTRKTPLSRKRKAPRQYKTPRCDYATLTGRHPCKKPQYVTWVEPGARQFMGILVASREHRGMCKVHAQIEAHIRVREFVRDRDGGRCVIPHADLFPCAGAWQPNHGFDRDEKTCTWAEWNVMGGCGAMNTWAHHNKQRWGWMLEQMWGKALYEERKQLVLTGSPMDLSDVLAKYPPAPKREQEAT